MNRDYRADIQDTEAIEHYGIVGQHWGQRRFQYANGTLTPEGRERYGYGPPRKERAKEALKKTGEKAAKAAKVATKATITAIKKRYPSLMTDEELIQFKNRLDLEKKYKDVQRDLRSRRLLNRFGRTVAFIAEKGAQTYVDTFARNSADRAVKKLYKTNAEKKSEETFDRYVNDATRNMRDVERISNLKYRRENILDPKIKKLSEKEDRTALDDMMLRRYKKERKTNKKETRKLKNQVNNRNESLIKRQRMMDRYDTWYEPSNNGGGGKKGKKG